MHYKSDKTASLDISTNDFVSPSFFPHDLTSADAQPLVHGFIASNRITDFMTRFKLQIVQNLIPGLRKDGYSEELSTTDTVANPRRDIPQPARPQPQAPPRAPEYDPSHIPPENPLSIGRRDLEPFPGLNPSNPFAPPPLFPPHGGDGMFVGPDHPIFGNRGRGGQGPWGGDGFLPPMGAPPGARFDPVGPGIVPFGPGFGGRGGRGRGGPPGGGNSRDPDNDEFMPPGAVSICYSKFTKSQYTDGLLGRDRVICSCEDNVIVGLDVVFPSYVTCTIRIKGRSTVHDATQIQIRHSHIQKRLSSCAALIIDPLHCTPFKYHVFPAYKSPSLVFPNLPNLTNDAKETHSTPGLHSAA